MPADPKFLRQHYASLSDDALRAIHRADLVDAAQSCYDDEVKQRDLASKLRVKPPVEEAEETDEAEPEDTEPDEYADDDSEHPDWLEDAAAVYSRADQPGNTRVADDLADARDALEAAGIPCHLDFSEMPEEQDTSPPPTHIWRLLVPGNLNLRATSVLERDIFNQEFEGTWQAHLETLSDAELRQMNPEVVFCGLFDKVERVNKVYEDELARRKLKL
jgi:hypothetical protein